MTPINIGPDERHFIFGSDLSLILLGEIFFTTAPLCAEAIKLLAQMTTPPEFRFMIAALAVPEPFPVEVWTGSIQPIEDAAFILRHSVFQIHLAIAMSPIMLRFEGLARSVLAAPAIRR